MNLTSDSCFSFNALIKLTPTIRLDIQVGINENLFPSLAEVSFNSRVFTSYSECVRSCKILMEELTSKFNEAIEGRNFTVGAEVNPEVSKTTSISEDWLQNEVSRFWIYDNRHQGKQLHLEAVCRGSIFVVKTPEISHQIH